MTDRTQFEAMLEALINEDQETAQEIFHNIVVAKSREIYEELLSEDFDVNEGENPFAKSEDDGEESEEEPADDADDAEGDDAEDDGESDDVGGDATDDMIGDVTDGEEDGAEGDMSDDEQTDRIMDLEDALEELKAEFEQLMAGEEGEEHMGGEEPAMGGDEFGGADLGAEEEDPMAVMEYTKKVSLPKHGDNGANTRSIVAKPNRMGGTSANIAKSFSTEKGGTEGGLLKPSTQPQDGGNINKPGANAGKTAFRKSEPGHGAEKKGSSEKADNKKSLIGGRQ
jgi:hypothetical protein